MTLLVSEHVAVIETETFKAENTKRFYDYYQRKRGERARPGLSDIDLMELYDIAPSLCIRDVVNGGQDLLCRYWGTEFTNVYKADCTGKLISEAYSPTGCQNTLYLHQRALSSGLPLRLIGNLGYTDKDVEHITFEGIMLSLDGKDGPNQHIVAVGQFDYRLDEEDLHILESQTSSFQP